MAHVQSITYVPEYFDGCASMNVGKDTVAVFNFEVSPAKMASEIAAIWQTAVTMKAIYTRTRSISFVSMPIKSVTAEGGILTVIASGGKMSHDFFDGQISASATLRISDGNNDKYSEYVPMIPCIIISVVDQNFKNYLTDLLKKPRGSEITDKEAASINNLSINNAAIKSLQGIQYCTNITNIECHCPSVKEIDLSKCTKIHQIKTHAFAGCTGLISISFPNSITSLGKNAFGEDSTSHCYIEKVNVTDLKAWCKIAFDENISPIPFASSGSLYLNDTLITDLVIPDGVTIINKGAFSSCNGIISVTIPNGVTKIDDRAFECCVNMTSVNIPNSVTTIGKGAFGGCVSLVLHSNTLPNSITSIGSDAFCSTGTYRGYLDYSITIPGSIKSISDGMFCASAVWGITIEDGVTSIGNEAFSVCPLLVGLTIPNSVQSIGYSAFANDTNLASITIPNNVQSIGSGAFNGCTSLRNVYIKATTPPTIEDDILYGTTNLLNIYVPTASVNAYKTANFWKNYALKIQGYTF